MINQNYGWRPDLPDQRDLPFSLFAPATLPKKVDLRASCPPVYDQGQLGSCTANGIGAAIEFGINKQSLPDFMPSRLFIYYNERVIENSVKSDSGAQIRDGIKTAAKDGVCPEKEWPYKVSKFKTRPPAKCYTDALKNVILKYERLTGIKDYKTALASGYPFVFGFTVYESFESDEVASTGIVPMPSGSALGGHCVMAVGYDDDKSWFICRNSWGPKWGDKGYFYLPYQYFTPSLTDDFWVIYTVK